MILINKNILCDLYYKFKLIKIFSYDFNYILLDKYIWFLSYNYHKLLLQLRKR